MEKNINLAYGENVSEITDSECIAIKTRYSRRFNDALIGFKENIFCVWICLFFINVEIIWVYKCRSVLGVYSYLSDDN